MAQISRSTACSQATLITNILAIIWFRPKMLKFLLLICCFLPQQHALLFPASSSLSITSSVSVPVFEFFPERAILMDWCFGMGHNLPTEPSSFYNVPIWPVSPSRKAKRHTDLEEEASHFDKVFEKYDHKLYAHKKRHAKDLSAGELYQAIEDFLSSFGIHETCLLRSVCDLARHPFDDQQQNVLTQSVTFLLTPSLHEGFDASEQIYRRTYQNAETRGFLGEDCTLLYSDCNKDLLGAFSKVIFYNS